MSRKKTMVKKRQFLALMPYFVQKLQDELKYDLADESIISASELCDFVAAEFELLRSRIADKWGHAASYLSGVGLVNLDELLVPTKNKEK